MKRLSFLMMSLALVCSASAQSILEIAQEQVCWSTPGGADSSLTRYVLISTRVPDRPRTLCYVDENGQVADVSGGGSFTPGFCGCCAGGSGGSDADWYFLTTDQTIFDPVWRQGRVAIGTMDTSHQLQLQGDWQFLPDIFGTRFDWQNSGDTTGTSWYGILYSAPSGLGGGSNLSSGRNNLTIATNNTVIDRTRLGVLAFAGNNPTDTDHHLSAFLDAVADGAWTGSSTASHLDVWVTNTGETFPRNTVTFQGDGRLELDRYFLFSDGLPEALLGYNSTTRDVTRHVIAGTPVPGSAIVVNGTGSGLEYGSSGGGGGGIDSLVFYTRLGYKLTAISTKAAFASIADSVFTIGDIIRTRGYTTPGDNGGAEYLIQTDTIAGYAVDGIAVIQLAVGKYAVLQGEQGFNAAAFGMSTSLLDNSVQLQKAIDFTILVASGGVSVLHLPAGEYRITKGVYIWDGGFTSMTISGPTSAYSSTQSIGKVTAIHINCNQCFGIAVQRGRNVEIQNISFRGNGITPPGETFVNVLEATWGGLSNNPQSPNAAVVIDPFHNTVAAPNQYPGFTAQYILAGASNSGSSHVKIKGCSFYTLGTAICISPNGSTQNGDNIRAEDISVAGCRYFWSTSQTQTKGNSIENIYVVGRLLAFVVANAHGAQKGKLPSVSNFNIASGVKYLSLGGEFRGLYTGGFSEGVVSLGTSSLDIVGCQFNFNQDSDRLPIMWSGSLLRVQNSILNYYNNCGVVGIYPMYFNGAVEVTNSSIEGAILAGKIDGSGAVAEQFKLENVSFQCPILSSYEKSHFIETTSETRGVLMDGACKVNYKNSYQEGQGSFWIWNARTGSMTVDTALRTGRIVMTNPSQIVRIGSVVSTLSNIDYPNDVFVAQRAPCGVVINVIADTIFLNRVPLGATNVTGSIYVGYYNYWTPRVLGSTTSGQNKIITTGFSQEALVADWNTKGPFLLSGRGIPFGTYATSWVADTIFLSQNATETGTARVFGGNLNNRNVLGADPSLVSTSLIFFVGDELLNISNARAPNSPVKWVCTANGVRGSATPPSWRAVYAPVSGNSSISTDAAGDVVITHGFGGTPNVVNITPVGNVRATLQALSSTNFTVRCYDGVTGTAIVSTPVTFYWNAQ